MAQQNYSAQGSAISFPQTFTGSFSINGAIQFIYIDNQTGATLTVSDLTGAVLGIVAPYQPRQFVNLQGWPGVYVAADSTTILSTDIINITVFDKPPLASGQLPLGGLGLAGNAFYRPLTLGPQGGIYQGTGTFANPITGLKLYSKAGIGTLEIWVNSVLVVSLGSNGLSLLEQNNSSLVAERDLKFLDSTGSGVVRESVIGYTDALFNRTLQLLASAVSPHDASILLEAKSGGNTGTLTLDEFGHLVSGATGTPSVAVGSNLGAGGSVSMVAGSNDTRGRINITTGNPTAAGQLAVLSFANNYAAQPFVVCQWSGIFASAYLSTNNSSNASIVINATPALANNTAYTLDYLILA